jgi:hypothetical protein
MFTKGYYEYEDSIHVVETPVDNTLRSALEKKFKIKVYHSNQGESRAWSLSLRGYLCWREECTLRICDNFSEWKCFLKRIEFRIEVRIYVYYLQIIITRIKCVQTIS